MGAVVYPKALLRLGMEERCIGTSSEDLYISSDTNPIKQRTSLLFRNRLASLGGCPFPPFCSILRLYRLSPEILAVLFPLHGSPPNLFRNTGVALTLANRYKLTTKLIETLQAKISSDWVLHVKGGWIEILCSARASLQIGQ